MSGDHSHLVIFGGGYVGARLARFALATGRPVRICSRGTARLEPLRLLGAEVVFMDATRPKQFGPALVGTMSPTVVYTIPPLADLPAGEAVRRATHAALAVGARRFVYLSTSGLYGNRPDADWVDEETPVAHDDPGMAARLADEAAAEGAASSGLPTVILRSAAIYGPGRGLRARLRRGEHKLIDDGRHWVSRIHVDDLVRIILAADERAPSLATYMVADDRPTTQREYAEWLCERLSLPIPPSVASLAPGAARTLLRGRRLRNERLKRELGVTLLYPTFLEGEAQIDGEEAGRAGQLLPEPPPVEEEPPPPAPAPPAKAPEPAAPPAPLSFDRPPFIRHYAALPTDGDRHYPESDELLSLRTPLAAPLGLGRLVVHHELLPPGRRTSWPHAHSTEEELVYVLEGHPDAWIDGRLVRLSPGDAIGLPGGTGVAHTFLNNTTGDARLLVVGEPRRPDDQVVYPANPEHQAKLPAERAWSDAPARERGDHDGRPTPRRR